MCVCGGGGGGGGRGELCVFFLKPIRDEFGLNEQFLILWFGVGLQFMGHVTPDP